MNRRLLILTAAGLTGVPMGTLSGQGTPYPDCASFFATLAAELSSHWVHAVDAQSFAGPLLETLGWTVTTADVEEFLDADFTYGPLDRFLSCEADAMCVMAERGAHIALVGVAAEGPQQVVLRLDRTGGEDRVLRRQFEFITLRHADGEWRVVDRRVLGVQK